jgi:dipeptidyl aminopeptidase/acylaminoacyl peptidase
MRPIVVLACLTLPPSLVPLPLLAQKRAITFEDYIALRSVSDPQLSPDGKWVAYTLSTPSLEDNRNVSRIWVVEVATGKSRQLTGGPGSDRQPRWSPDGKALAFISTREGGAQVWLLPIAGGDARKISGLADGASDPLWLPDGSGLLVVSDIKWPPNQEIDQRNGQYSTEAKIWTGLMWRHWADFRAGKRQHVFRRRRHWNSDGSHARGSRCTDDRHGW